MSKRRGKRICKDDNIVYTNGTSESEVFDGIIFALKTLTGVEWGFTKEGSNTTLASKEISIVVHAGLFNTTKMRNLKKKGDTIVVDNNRIERCESYAQWLDIVSMELQGKLIACKLPTDMLDRVLKWRPSDDFILAARIAMDYSAKHRHAHEKFAANEATLFNPWVDNAKETSMESTTEW